VQPTELPHLQQQLMEEIEGLNASDESIERLGEELAAFAQHYKEKARELSGLRQQAASSWPAPWSRKSSAWACLAGASASS
jgi:DNA repair protein RecN (Recombination protein N)